MKKFWFNFVIILLIVLLPIGGFFVYGGLIQSHSVYSETYYAELKDKVERLKTREGKKIVFIGGSSLIFGLRSEEIEKATGYEVVDFGLYASYYLEEVLGNRGRFGNNCDSFVFISDTFADKLIELYGINSEDPYRTLIQEEEYYVLPLTTGGGDTIKFCINNILYSDSRSASRTYDLYGDFALFYYNGKVSPYLQLEFEIDLKDSPYSIKKTINDMEQLGYRTDNYLISFKQFDNKAGFYTMSEILNNSYLSLQSKKTIDVLTGVGIFGIIMFSILFLYFFSRKRKISKSEKRIIFIIDLFFSVVFGVIVTFIYNYPWFSIGFLVQLIFTVILFRKELVNGEIFFNQRESIQNGCWKNMQFYEIKI